MDVLPCPPLCSQSYAYGTSHSLLAWCRSTNLVAVSFQKAGSAECSVAIFEPIDPEEHTSLRVPLQDASDHLIALEWAPAGHRKGLLTATKAGGVVVWSLRPNDLRAANLAPFLVVNDYHAYQVAAVGTQQLLMGTWLHDACPWRWRTQDIINADFHQHHVESLFLPEPPTPAAPSPAAAAPHWVRPATSPAALISPAAALTLLWASLGRGQLITWHTSAPLRLLPAPAAPVIAADVIPAAAMQLRAALVTADAPALVLVVGVQGDMTLPPGGPAGAPQVAQLVRVPLEGVHRAVGLRWLRTGAGLSLSCLGSSADKPSTGLTPPTSDAATPPARPPSTHPAGPPSGAAPGTGDGGSGGGDGTQPTGTTAAAAAATLSNTVANGSGGSVADAQGGGGGGAEAAGRPVTPPSLAGLGGAPSGDGGSRLLHCQFLPQAAPSPPQDDVLGAAAQLPPPLGYLMQPAVTLPPLVAGASGNPLHVPFHGSCAAVVTTRGIAVIDTECRSVALLPARAPAGPAPAPPTALAFSPNGCCLCAVYPPPQRPPPGRRPHSHVLVLPLLEPLPMTAAQDPPPPGASPPHPPPPPPTRSGEAADAGAAAAQPGAPQQPDTPASGAGLPGPAPAPAGSSDTKPDGTTTAAGAQASAPAEDTPPEQDPVVKVAAARAAWGMLVAHTLGDVVLFCRGLWGVGRLLPAGRAALQAALRYVDVVVQRYPVYTRMAYALAADRFKAQVLAGLPDTDALVTRVDAMARLVVWDMEAVAHLTWTVEDSSAKGSTTDRIALRLLPPETLEHTLLPWLAYIPQVAGLMVQCVAAWVARHKEGTPAPQRDWLPFVRLLPDMFFTKRLTGAITFWTALYSHVRIKERLVAVWSVEEVKGMEVRMVAAKNLLHLIDQLTKRAQAPLPAAEALAVQLLTELRAKLAAQEGRQPVPGQVEAAVASVVHRAREGECCMALLHLLNLPANASAPDLKEIKDLLRRQVPHAMRDEQQKRSNEFMWALHEAQHGLALHYYRVGAPIRPADLEQAKGLDSLPQLSDGMWQQAAAALGLLQPHRPPPTQLIPPTAAAFQHYVAADQLPPPPPFACLAGGEAQGRLKAQSRKRWRDDLDGLLHLGTPAPPRHALDALTRKPLGPADLWAYETVDGTAVAMDVEGLLRAASASSHVDHIRRSWLAAAPTTGVLWKRVRLDAGSQQRRAGVPGGP